MTAQTKTTLKGYFNTGDTPSEANFADLIDTIGTPTLTVAANGASNASKGRADYVCDGTADDVQINAALNALPAASGRVLLSEGTFDITAQITLGHKDSLIGTGWNTYLQAASGLNASVITLDDVQAQQCYVAHLAIDGDSANQTAGSGIHFNNTGRTPTSEAGDAHHLIDRVLIYDTKDHGIYLQGDCRETVVRDCRIRTTGQYGFYSNGAADLKLVNVIVGQAGEYGFLCGGVEIQLVNCKAFGCGAVTAANGIGFRMNTSHALMVNCWSEENTRQGYSLTGNNISACHCTAVDNGETTARRPGFYIAADYISLVGCWARDTRSGDDRTQNYGVQLANGSDYLRINMTTLNHWAGSLDDQGATNLTNEIVAW